MHLNNDRVRSFWNEHNGLLGAFLGRAYFTCKATACLTVPMISGPGLLLQSMSMVTLLYA